MKKKQLASRCSIHALAGHPGEAEPAPRNLVKPGDTTSASQLLLHHQGSPEHALTPESWLSCQDYSEQGIPGRSVCLIASMRRAADPTNRQSTEPLPGCTLRMASTHSCTAIDATLDAGVPRAVSKKPIKCTSRRGHRDLGINLGVNPHKSTLSLDLELQHGRKRMGSATRSWESRLG